MIEIQVAARDDGGVVVAVSGDLDAFAVPALQHCVDGMLAAGEETVLLDLAGVGVFGAAAVTTCERLQGAARRSGGDLRLANPPRLVRRVLEATGHLHLLEPAEERRSAPQAAAAAPA